MKLPCDTGTTPTRIPLLQRLYAAGAWGICDEKLLDVRLSHINHFPLKLWFFVYPNRLDVLTRVFPEIYREDTFGQAAAALYCRLKIRDGNLQYDPLVAAGMWMLFSPLLDVSYHLTIYQEGDVHYWCRK